MKKRYTPGAGDIVWVHFDAAAAGRGKSADHKSAVVLSPLAYNKKTGLMVCCPIVSTARGYPFEVAIKSADECAALSDQVKSIDWAHSKITLHGRASSTELATIRAKLHALVFKG